ncbi:MAG: hypothetical protein HZB25_13975 [Candidatus Eisenbacteria bacterium]|nr:hypothetical protein [Candidatus Eisenbacteria bacterium]
MRHTRITQAGIPMWILLAVFSVSFLLTYLPSPCAAGTEPTAPGTTISTKGGPDDPDDGKGDGHGIPGPGVTSIRPRTPQIGISSPSTPPAAPGIHAPKVVMLPGERGFSLWLMALRTFIHVAVQVR